MVIILEFMFIISKIYYNYLNKVQHTNDTTFKIITLKYTEYIKISILITITLIRTRKKNVDMNVIRRLPET